jgi:FkbM family methyltransferase
MSKGARRLLDRYLIPSFSQFGEDRVLSYFFQSQDRGFYVDVGCNHPVAYSNTWLLYLKGWNGIAIDANPALIAQYQAVRRRDIAIVKAISNKEECVDFFIPKDSPLTSGIGRKSSGHWKRAENNSSILRCNAQRLDSVLEECNAPKNIDLLSIDVEGHELKVLDSLDFDVYKPKIIVVEMHGFELDNPSTSDVYMKLIQHNYKLIGYFAVNGFFALME